MANSSSVGHFRIVVGVDFSDISLVALEQAFDTAVSRRSENPEVHAIVVVDDGAGGLALGRLTAEVDAQLKTAQGLITDRVEAIRRARLASLPADQPTIKVATQVRVGDPVDELVSVALELRASLVVVGTHGRRGLRRLMLGSVAERVARRAPCPVLIARLPDFASMEAVARVEPADPGAPPPSTTETHTYGYRSALEPETPPNHLL